MATGRGPEFEHAGTREAVDKRKSGPPAPRSEPLAIPQHEQEVAGAGPAGAPAELRCHHAAGLPVAGEHHVGSRRARRLVSSLAKPTRPEWAVTRFEQEQTYGEQNRSP